jgi:hypothetical protein
MEQALRRRIHRMFLHGKTIPEIQRILNEEGINVTHKDVKYWADPESSRKRGREKWHRHVQKTKEIE